VLITAYGIGRREEERRREGDRERERGSVGSGGKWWAVLSWPII
jgi:hypothetical protein